MEIIADGGGPRFRYDPGPFDVWSCAVILFFMLAGDKLHNTIGRRKAPGFNVFSYITADRPVRDFGPLVGLLGNDPRDMDPTSGVPLHTRFWARFGAGLTCVFKITDSCRVICSNAPWFGMEHL